MKYLISIIVIVLIIVGVIALANKRDGLDVNNNQSVEITSEMVAYHGTTTGFYAHPSATGTYPGVVMIHEWWGLNDHIKDKAMELASQGYNVLAVDLYGGRVAGTSSEAMRYRSETTPEETTRNTRSAVTFLGNAGSEKIASLGWCYGGGKSLELAMSGETLDATVIYYGSLSTSTQALGVIDWPVLGIFGAEDRSISTTTVDQFREALDEAEIPNQIYVYPGVGHAFANPSGDNYSSTEANDAWEKTLAFLRGNLAGEK